MTRGMVDLLRDFLSKYMAKELVEAMLAHSASSASARDDVNLVQDHYTGSDSKVLGA